MRMIVDFLPELLRINLVTSIVILIILGARLILKRAPKVFSYALWAIVLIRLLIPVSIQSPISVVPNTPAASGAVINSALPEIEFETPRDREQNYYESQNTTSEDVQVYVSRTMEPIVYLSIAWLIGMAVMVLYSGISYLKIRRMVRIAIPLRDNIWIADDIKSPFVIGFIKPKIYLPNNLGEQEQEYITLHEQHHIRRFDHVIKALAFLALTIHWFNPLVWIAFVLACKDMEMSCDEAVIRKLGSDVRADYSASLLTLTTGHRIIAGTPLDFGEGETMDRIKNLAKLKKPTTLAIIICVVICTVLVICLLTDPVDYKPMELPQKAAEKVNITLNNDPLPEGYFEDRDEHGNTIFTDGTNTVGGVIGYQIPEGCYNPDEHIEVLLYKMGIPDYMDTSLYFRGGMTSGDNGWLAEFESDVPDGEEPTVYRRHHFTIMEEVVYDIWFDMTLLDYEKAEEIRVCVNLPTEGNMDSEE